MGEEILLKDGVRYLPYTPKCEKELEETIREHIKDIFGEDAIYFEKRMIATKAGIASVPDGFVVDFKNRKWWVIEVELSSHSPYSHGIPQIKKFQNALLTYQTRENLRKAIYQGIKENPKVKASIETEDLHKLVWDVLDSEPKIVIIIERKTAEWAEAIGKEYKIIEFRTYKREDVEVGKVYIYQFEPITPVVIKKPEEKKPKREKIERTPHEAFRLPILETLIEMGDRGMSKKVIAKVGEKLKGTFKRMDYEKRKGGRVRWKTPVVYESKIMEKEGLIKKIKPLTWEITEKGRQYYEEHKETQA